MAGGMKLAPRLPRRNENTGQRSGPAGVRFVS
jgi:hypothetical protein